MFLVLRLYHNSLFLKSCLLLANLGLHNCQRTRRKHEKGARFQFIDLAFLVVFELVHVLFELTALLLGGLLFILGCLDSQF